jgi:hypothetical protein
MWTSVSPCLMGCHSKDSAAREKGEAMLGFIIGHELGKVSR